METLSIAIVPHRYKHNELLSTCNRIASETLKVNGCIDCRVPSDSGAGSTIRIEQHWRQRNLMEDYIRSDHFSALMGAMRLLASDYEVSVNDGSPSEGMFIVERVRNRG